MLGRTTATVPTVERNRVGLWLTLLAALAISLIFAVAAGPARADYTHKYVGEFGTVGGGYSAGDYNTPLGIAVDTTNGDLYVVNSGVGKISVSSAAGDYLRSWDGSGTPAGYFSQMNGIAVDGTNDRVYVTDEWNNVVDVFDRTGTYVSQLSDASVSNPTGVAVDTSTGDVYVLGNGSGTVAVFDSAGTFLSSFGSMGSGDGQLMSPMQIAVDPNSHDVYVVDSGNSRVEEFGPGGAFVATLAGTNSPSAVAVDPSNGDVFVGENNGGTWQIARYDSSGNRLYAVPLHDFVDNNNCSGTCGHGIPGLATSTSTHRVYAVDGYTSWNWPPASQVVQIFAAFTIPTVTTGPASGVDSSSATLSGSINPNGDGTPYHWDYGLDTSYGSSGGWGYLPAGTTTDTPVSGSVSGLQPNATYHYRLVAQGSAGTAYGADQTFTTLAAPPAVDGESANPVATDSATLHAAVNPNNSATTYHFLWGEGSGPCDAGTDTATTGGSLGAVYGDQDATDAISGLQPDTTYHFCVVTNNGTGGDVTGSTATFTTAPADVPTASDIQGQTATLNGVIDVPGSGTYHFEYGTDTSYGTNTPEVTADSVSGPQSVSSSVSGLQPGTTYHFRVVATGGGNTMQSADGTFTTLPTADVVTQDASDVSDTSAALHGTVDTHGVPGTYRFHVTGIGSTVDRETPEQAITSSGPTAVSAAISDLPASGDYDVVLEATVGGVTTSGDAKEFKTLAATPIVPRTVPPTDTTYGCSSPHLDQPTLPATPGKAYTLTGSGLGIGGQVVIAGGPHINADAWSAGAVTFTVPDDATGTLSVTVDCGTASNAVTITIPSNAFTIVSATTRGSVGKVKVKVPGAGKLHVSGKYLRSGSKTARKAGTYTITVKLNSVGAHKLRRSHHLTAAFKVTFTPTGGVAASQTDDLVFNRKGHKRG